MNRRDIVVGVIVVVLLVLLFNRLSDSENSLQVDEGELASGQSVEEQVEEALGLEAPDTGEKIELSSIEGQAVVTRDIENGYKVSVLADLPDTDKTYQVWLSDGADDPELVSVGVLASVKGGYTLETNSGVDPEVFGEVIISQEDTVDSQLEDRVLAGSFE